MRPLNSKARGSRKGNVFEGGFWSGWRGVETQKGSCKMVAVLKMTDWASESEGSGETRFQNISKASLNMSVCKTE